MIHVDDEDETFGLLLLNKVYYTQKGTKFPLIKHAKCFTTINSDSCDMTFAIMKISFSVKDKHLEKNCHPKFTLNAEYN